MSSSIEVRTCENLEDLNENATIYTGRYISTVSQYITLGEAVEGRYLRIIFNDNVFVWKDIQEDHDLLRLELVRNLSIQDHVFVWKDIQGCKWRIEKGGYRTNARAFVGKAGDEYSITVPTNSDLLEWEQQQFTKTMSRLERLMESSVIMMK